MKILQLSFFIFYCVAAIGSADAFEVMPIQAPNLLYHWTYDDDLEGLHRKIVINKHILRDPSKRYQMPLKPVHRMSNVTSVIPNISEDPGTFAWTDPVTGILPDGNQKDWVWFLTSSSPSV